MSLKLRTFTQFLIEKQNMDFITVKTFSFPAEVPVVQSFMQMKGIEVYMKNYISNRMAYTFGEIEMQVKTDDFERAKATLIEGGFATIGDFEDFVK